MNSEATLTLSRPLETVIAAGHPWVWSRSLERFTAAPGEIARVVDTRGRFVARGVVDGGDIALRIWTTRDERIDESLLRSRFRAAAALRDRVLSPETTAYRFLHGEGDLTPGYVCDVYGSVGVLSADGAGAAARVGELKEILGSVLAERGVSTLLYRSRRKNEGHAVEVLQGRAPEGVTEVRENAMVLCADLVRGQKTGLFLDQRESRARVRRLSHGLRVLNLYSYTGGFSVAAALGGARAVTSVDIAPGAIELAEATWAANGLDRAQHEAIVGDVSQWLTEARKRGVRFDLVIADPPSFAPNEASVELALRAYVKLHTAALSLVAPGGLYLAGSCSSHIDRTRFIGTLAEAVAKGRRTTQLLDVWGAPEDHPRLVAFPEGDYLKNALLRVW